MATIQELFRKARLWASRPRHAPTVARTMLEKYFDDIVADPELHQYALMNGILPTVESFMKRRRKASETADTTPPLPWPDGLLPIVTAIDRDALYVPSLDEYVELRPGISPEHLHEAAFHLRGHAADTVRVANLIDQLADALIPA